MTRYRLILGSAIGAALCANPILAQDNAPEDLLPPEPARVTEPLPDYTRDAPRPAPQPSVEDSFDDIRMSSGEVVQQLAHAMVEKCHFDQIFALGHAYSRREVTERGRWHPAADSR